MGLSVRVRLLRLLRISSIKLSGDGSNSDLTGCMRDAGKAILLISADLAEIMSLSDSLIVMHSGKINAYFPDIKKLTEEDLGFYMLGVKHMSEEEIRGALHE